MIVTTLEAVRSLDIFHRAVIEDMAAKGILRIVSLDETQKEESAGQRKPGGGNHMGTLVQEG